MRGTPIGATVYGIDLGKNTFHVVGVDAYRQDSPGQPDACIQSGVRHHYAKWGAGL